MEKDVEGFNLGLVSGKERQLKKVCKMKSKATYPMPRQGSEAELGDESTAEISILTKDTTTG
jgi:hypothetical protein